jgi:FAD:protein FMN transferase
VTAGWSRPAMDTLVTIRVAGDDSPEIAEMVERAFDWFTAVEEACSRFRPDSEVSRLAFTTGRPVQVSPLLAAALDVALDAATATAGVFDPTLGAELARRGFDTDHRTGERFAVDAPGGLADVDFDPETGTVTLDRPVCFDLGAVAKGLAVDLAARELADLPGATVDAGGDAWLHGGPWPVGLADPHQPNRVLTELSLTDVGIATSGGYARPGHLIVPPDRAAEPAAQVTVLAGTAIAADLLSTVALLLGVEDGLDLLEDTEGVAGLLIAPDGTQHPTRDWPELR